jgi:phospholipid/cholesterol/gamma-HCH transport system substrate-binding protein
MRQKDFIKKFSAGIFFFACIVMIVGVVFVLGLEKGFTEPKFKMTVLFHKVGGLAIGAPVRLSGVTVGTVSDIDFLDEEVDDRSVTVSLNLYKKYYKQLRKSERFAVITEGVLGEKIIEITSRPDFFRNNLEEPVVGEDPLDVQDLAETFGDAAVALLKTSETIDSIIKDMREISGDIRRLLNRIEQRIIDGNLFKVF